MAKKPRKDTATRPIFSNDEQLFDDSLQKELEEQKSQPVECLGMTFPNDAERRAYFMDKLQEKLKDPEFRKTPGFPRGEDEHILRMSDPPYYTACPNPFLSNFITANGSRYTADLSYSREPFAADVSEGKNNAIYNAHSYHTKVPHRAIMRYILHYTEPGDVVLDGFCGTGMTGVAAQLCDDTDELAALGLTLKQDGTLENGESMATGKKGVRHCILNDLSPAATLIASGYNLTTTPESFPPAANAILQQFTERYGWMYRTVDEESGDVCEVEYTIWSDVFSCPECSGELEFWAIAYNSNTGAIDGSPTCPHCKAEVTKRDLVRRTTSYFDAALGVTREKQVTKPVEIRYKHRGQQKAKKPDEQDLHVLARIEEMLPSVSYPTELMMFRPEGEGWGDLQRGYHAGITRVHDFHLPRQLLALALLWSMGDQLPNKELQRMWRFTIQSVAISFTRRNRFLRKCVRSRLAPDS
jgi:hypothetical protein